MVSSQVARPKAVKSSLFFFCSGPSQAMHGHNGKTHDQQRGRICRILLFFWGVCKLRLVKGASTPSSGTTFFDRRGSWCSLDNGEGGGGGGLHSHVIIYLTHE